MQFDELFTEKVEYVPGSGPEGNLPASGAVYLLTDVEDRFVQLAATADLRRALTQRLGDVPAAGEQAVEGKALGSGRPRADLREIVRRIRWRPAYSMFEITLEYYRVARLLMPETYLKQVGFGPSWFVSVDPAAEIPRFQVGKVLRSPAGMDLGPFATQAEAGRFVEILEDAFDLCRYYQILQQAPAGQACAYFDMGKCPAPCDGSIPMERYREMVERALAFAAGERQRVFAGWEEAMRAAAAERAFERAGATRQRIERARRLEHESYRLVRPMAAFRYLVIQRGGGTTRVKPFYVRGGHVEAGPAVRLKNLAEAAPGWIEAMRAEPPADADRESASEHVWLVSHFLFKREPPGMFLHADSLGDAAALAEQTRECFAAPKKEELRDLGGAEGATVADDAPSASRESES